MTAEQQLKGFIAKFAPPNQKLIRAVRKTLRARLPSANELAYDNYNFFVIAYCPTEKPTDSFFSLAAGASGVNIAFGYLGTKLDDPDKLLVGSGKLNRMLRVPDAKTLDRENVKSLIAQSLEVGKVPLPPKGKGRLIIRSISPKQRPRR
jgi:hypothetical protein